MSSAPSESQRCVDEVLFMMTSINNLVERLTEKKEADEQLVQQSREMLDKTQHFIDEHKLLIPAYSLKKVSDSMRLLENHLNSAASIKLKFKFRPTHSHVLPQTQSTSTTSNSVVQSPLRSNTDMFYGFKDQTGATLTLDIDRSEARDVSLVNLVDCTVRIIGNANTIYINSLTHTSVTVCLAKRAIRIIDCKFCQFNLICQQLRIDSTRECDFSIYTSARSMLETSGDIKFAPLKLDKIIDCNIELINELMRDNNFNWIDNNWRCIDDFDWLVPGSPSKNYQLIDS